MELKVGVKIVLQNKQGKYLLLFRNEYKPQAGVFWDIPGGGINVGSTLMENLRREVFEETGLEINTDVKLIAAQDILGKYKDKHVVRLTYTGFAEGDIVLSEEHSKYQWFSKDEISVLDTIDPYLKEVLEKFLF
ncbi:MAG: NUDIX hydrolase [Patescibacteria group bacterium]